MTTVVEEQVLDLFLVFELLQARGERCAVGGPRGLARRRNRDHEKQATYLEHSAHMGLPHSESGGRFGNCWGPQRRSVAPRWPNAKCHRSVCILQPPEACRHSASHSALPVPRRSW